MTEPGYNVITDVKEIPNRPDQRPSMNPRPIMNGMDQSYSIANSWYAYLPLELVLGKRYGNLELHLTRFSIPQMEMGSMAASYKGYEKVVPTKVLNAGTKELTLEYIIDEYWQNYKALWAWLSCITGVLNPMTDDKSGQGISPTEYITLRIYLLNNYKKKVIQFEFYNCWLRVFNDLALDVADQNVIKHSFTFCYDDMKMVEV